MLKIDHNDKKITKKKQKERMNEPNEIPNEEIRLNDLHVFFYKHDGYKHDEAHFW